MTTSSTLPPRFYWTKGSRLFERFRKFMGNWTQESMADFIDVPVDTWRNWEWGRAEPDPERTKRLNEAAAEQGFRG